MMMNQAIYLQSEDTLLDLDRCVEPIVHIHADHLFRCRSVDYHDHVG